MKISFTFAFCFGILTLLQTLNSLAENGKPQRKSCSISLANLLADQMGLKRPAKSPPPPLPPFSNTDTLPKKVLTMVLQKMGNNSNFSTVAYGASNIRDPSQVVMAEWMKQDARAGHS